MHIHIVGIMQCRNCILVAMRCIFTRTDGQDVKLRSGCIRLGWAHLSIMKHPVALLCKECHVHRKTFRRAAALVPQRLLRLHEVLHTQQRSCQKVPRLGGRSQLRNVTIKLYSSSNMK